MYEGAKVGTAVKKAAVDVTCDPDTGVGSVTVGKITGMLRRVLCVLPGGDPVDDLDLVATVTLTKVETGEQLLTGQVADFIDPASTLPLDNDSGDLIQLSGDGIPFADETLQISVTRGSSIIGELEEARVGTFHVYWS